MSLSEEIQRELNHLVGDCRSAHDVLDARLTGVEKDVGILKAETAGKVPWAWFLTTMVAIAGLHITLWFYLVNQIKEVQVDGQETKNTVAEINGKLEPFDFIINE